MGPNESGSFRVPAQSAVAVVRHLAPGSGSSHYGCFLDPLGDPMEGVYQPAMVVAAENPVKDCDGPGRRDFDNSLVDNLGLVAPSLQIDRGPPEAPPPDPGPNVVSIRPGQPGAPNPDATHKRFDRVEYNRERYESEGLPPNVAQFYAGGSVIKSEKDTIARLERVRLGALENGVDLLKTVKVGLWTWVYHRTLLAASSKLRKDRFSEATMLKYVSAVVTLLKVDPSSGKSLSDDTLIKELKDIMKRKLPGPMNVKMEHTFDPEYVFDYLDRDGGPTIVENAMASPVLIQLRLVVAMLCHFNRRGADVSHILRSGCSVTENTEVILLFEYLKAWGSEPHEITYEIPPDIPSTRDPAALLTCHLLNRDGVLSADESVMNPFLLLCKHANGIDLVAKNPTANTIHAWIRKLLAACGFPEFSTNDLLKTFVSADANLTPFGTEGNKTRWKSPKVMWKHYVKPVDATVWPPLRLREDPEELRSE